MLLQRTLLPGCSTEKPGMSQDTPGFSAPVGQQVGWNALRVHPRSQDGQEKYDAGRPAGAYGWPVSRTAPRSKLTGSSSCS
jgi:hypothetical protein